MSLIQEALKRRQQEAEGGLTPPPVPAGKEAPFNPLAQAELDEPSGPPPVPVAIEPDEDEALENIVPQSVMMEAKDKPKLARRQADEPEEVSEDDELEDGDDEPEESEGVAMEAGEESKRSLVAVLGVVLLLVLLVGGAVWAILYALQNLGMGKPKPEPVPTTAEAPVEPPAAPVEPEPVVKKPPVTEPVSVPPAVPVKPEPVVTVPTPPEVDPTAEVSPTPAVNNVAVTASGENEKPPVVWPYLTLTGIVGRGKSGSAMINGQIVDVGAYIDGVKVISIEKHAALLEYEGEQQLLRVGKSTE